MFSFQPYGQQWRDRRRAFWQEFNPEHGRINHRPVQLQYARDLIRRLYESPLDFDIHARHMIAAAILTITYGLDIQEKGDPNIAMADKALKHLDVAFIGTYMVDVLPFLRNLPRWMPGAGFQTTGESSRHDLRLMVELPYAKARKLLQEGRGESSFIHRALSRRHITDGGKEERDIMETAATAYLGASETSLFSVVLFFAAMAQNPDVQAKAQQELDQHLDHRLPDFDDQPHLPYTFAVMLETLRWQPIAPLGVPHSLVSDDEYKGYYLPNGSIVFYNIWAILRDEAMFPEPDTFNPSRFLKDGEINTQLRDRVMTTFGFGRRICPGRYYALDGLWISMVSILSVFTIGKATNGCGHPIDIDLEYTADLNSLLPFVVLEVITFGVIVISVALLFGIGTVILVHLTYTYRSKRSQFAHDFVYIGVS
ncbi:hypothetical protein CCMSSC00406_0007256 [Pleurotus cornucopiae]|uniref:Uncharacterized protein n=1 Tax=Pleurotus cornucopiae TaxID=5321 RepID=A0ACB7ILC3_PLECO|nr:hypothetical protein CCMSSC00406_0007256 [Pleurotus cornucopiae]